MLAGAQRLLDAGGLSALTVESVAADTGIAKTTIYRHWSNASELALDALLQRVNNAVPDPDTGSLHHDLQAQVRAVAVFLESHDGALLIELLGKAQSQEELKTALYQRFYAPARDMTIKILRRGQQRGELEGRPADHDLELIVDLLIAPLYWQHLIGRKTPTADDADYIVATVLGTAQ